MGEPSSDLPGFEATGFWGTQNSENEVTEMSKMIRTGAAAVAATVILAGGAASAVTTIGFGTQPDGPDPLRRGWLHL